MAKKSVTKLLLPILLLVLFSSNGYSAIEILRPDSAGDYAQWDVFGGASDYGVTSDIDNSTYIYTLTLGEIDLMNIENSSVGAGNINNVTIWITNQVYGGGGAGEEGNTYIKTNGIYDTGFKIVFEDYPEWRDDSEFYALNPQTASAWTWTEINELQAGAITSKHDNDEEMRISEVWVVINYEPAPSGTLNVTLITPAGSSSTNVTQDDTFLVNASIRCMDGSCGNVEGAVRYNASTSDPDKWINTTVDGSPFWNQTGLIPWSCGNLIENDLCTLNWTVKATGSAGTSWYLDVNFSSDGGSADNDTANFQINITAKPIGILNVSLITPIADSSTKVSQNVTFEVKAGIRCLDGECGTVAGSVRYNNTVSEPDTLIPTAQGGTPFYNVSGLIPWSCGAMGQNDYCQLNWTVNATGEGSYYLDANFSSSVSPANNTDNFQINISIPANAWLNVTLVDPSPMSSTNITQNSTFWVNASVKCMDAFCHLVVGAVKYNASSSKADKWINTTVGGTPFWNQSGRIPVSCGVMFKNDICILNWTVNGTGNIGTSWTMNANFTSFNNSINEKSTPNFQINISGGVAPPPTPILNVTLITPIPSSSTNVTQNTTIKVNGSVRCLNAGCGNVSGSIRYNISIAEPNFLINTTLNGVPFSNSTGLIPYNCGILNQNDLCILNWTVNVTGSIGISYYLDANFTSNQTGTPDNNTLNFQINITAPPPVDNTPPSVIINDPDVSGNYSGNMLINATVTDADSGVNSSGVFYWIENVSGNVTEWKAMSNVSSGNWQWYNATFDSTSVSDGIYNVTINASDNEGNQNVSEKIEFKIDNTLPYISITIPSENQNLSGNNITVNGTVTDNNKIINNPAINDSRFTLDSYNSGTGDFGFINNSQIADGTVAVVVNFTDDAGNTNTSNTRTFVVDNTRSRVGFITPLQDQNKTGLILINASINDTTSGVQNAYYWLEQSGSNVTEWKSMSLGAGTIYQGYWNATFNSGSLSDGLYNITINATDYSSNQNASVKVEITIDNTVPTVVFITPEANVNISSNFLVNTSVNDTTSGIKDVYYWLEQSGSNVTEWKAMSLGSGNKNNGYWNATVDISSISDGLYNITINATDYVNLQNATEKREVTIDKTVPTVNFIEPTPDEKKVSSFLINVSINDSTSGVQSAYYWIENVSGNVTAWTDMSLGSGTISQGYWNATFNPSGLAYGTYNITVNATDYASNQNYTEKRQFIYTTPILNVTLIYPSASSSTNVTQNTTFLVNASVRCLIGDCGTVVGSVRYNRTTNEPDLWVNTTLNGIPLSNSTGQIPWSCGTLNQNELCVLNWSVNATGNTGVSYYLDVNFTSSLSQIPDNNTLNFQINITPPVVTFGILNVSLITPAVDSSTNITQNNTIQVKTLVRCMGGNCGTVAGSVRYNRTAFSEPNFLINTTLNGIPFSNATGLIPWSCGILNDNDVCQLNWTVNVTGSGGLSYYLDGNFTSSEGVVADNNTLNFQINITLPAPAGAGILNVTLIIPTGNINREQNKTFNLKASVKCLAGDCGNVSGAVRYNKTTSLPDYWINTTLNGIPLSNSSGLIPWNCGILNQNDLCTLNWSVNVTGTIGKSYWLDANFSSNQSVANDTINFKVTITAPIGLHNTTWKYFWCQNETHQVMNVYNESGNLTWQYYPCAYGCDMKRGLCNDAGGLFQYGYLVAIVYLILISVCLVSTRIVSEEHGALKFLFFILSLIFVWSLIVQIGSMVEPMQVGQNFSSTDTIQSTGMLLSSVGNTFIWVIFLVVGYFIMMLIMNVLKSMGKLGKGNVL